MPTVAAFPKLTPVKLGPWRGRKSSTTRDLVPPDYVYTGQNSLFVPNSEIEGRKGVGHWRRRDGQTQLFDTFGASSVGLLPAKWNGHARWMRAFKSDSISDGQDTVLALVTKEDMDSASVLDDGRFSNLYIRDQVQNTNYTLGSEYSSTTYPVPGTEQSYKYIPVWYESGDGGITRGVTERDRRWFGSGSRRFLKAQRWWYLPNRFGTPLRTQFGSSEAGSTDYHASSDIDGFANSAAPGKWVYKNASTSGTDALTSADGSKYLEINNAAAGLFTMTGRLNTPTLPSSTTSWVVTAVIKLSHEFEGSPVIPYAGAATWQIIFCDNAGNKYTCTATNIAGTAGESLNGSWTTVTFSTALGTIVAGGSGTANTIVLNAASGADFSPTFRIDEIKITGLTGGSSVTRVIPSGPLPPTWPGKLTTGSAVTGTAASETLFPNADRTDGSWLNSAGNNTDLYSYIDDASFSDYIKIATDNSECVIDLANPVGTPEEGDQVVLTVVAQTTGALSTGNLTIKLTQGSTQIASRTALVGTSQQSFTLTLSDMEIGTVTDWTDMRLSLTMTSHAVTLTDLRVGYAKLVFTPGAAEGGWKGSKRFFHSIAYVFEDGSTWMPVIPRLPSADNSAGLGFFTVDINQPDVNFDKITWTLPKPPHGVIAMRLLRGLSIDATLDDNRLLSPYDMRIVATVPATADTYDDFASDDSSLEDDPTKAVIHFKHSMPPRTRYLAGGEQRVAAMYGGLGPCAVELAPIGVTADYDLNYDDETDSIYGATYASYFRVSIDSAGAGQLELTKSDGATLVATKTYAFSTYNTLQRLIDVINSTTCATDSLQWRAQLAPGVTGSQNPNTVLTPHKRVIASCVATNTSDRLTKSAGGLSKVAIGTRISKTGVTAGTYVIKIISDTELQMSAAATSTSTSDATFYADTGDNPTATETNTGWQRAIANSLPPFLYFNATYLATFGIDADRVWLTAASPFQTRSAANNFTTLDEHTYRPPSDAGIGVGIASPERGFVLLWERQRGYIANEVEFGTGEDRDYKVRIANSHQGCCAWDSIAAGNGFVTFAAPDGIYAAQIAGTEYEEAKLTDDIWRQWPDPRGDFSYEIPLAHAATSLDDDTGKLSVRVERNWIWCQYRASGSHPNRQIVMDFSAGAESFGLTSLMAEDGRPWPWSPPLIRSVTSICEVVRSNGSHIYAWNEENAGSTGDGRIDEIETGDTDNGTAITGTVESGWIKGDHDERLAAQEFFVCHLTPTGASSFLDFYRSRQNDGPYTLTLTATGTADVTDELKFLTQAARVQADAVRWVWRQTAGDACELRPSELRLLRLQRFK